jgi:hypothetical protein
MVDFILACEDFIPSLSPGERWHAERDEVSRRARE